MGLVARHLEEHGIPTLIIGSARDIIEHCGVPRFLYLDFPLGNPCGKPYDKEMQFNVIKKGISLLQTSTAANSIEQLEYSWADDNAWRDDYSKVDDGNRAELARRGEDRRRQQAAEKAAGRTRAAMIAEG